MRTLALVAAAVIAASGCKTVYTVDRQVPAEIFLGGDVRVIGVAPFQSDDAALSMVMSEKLSARLVGSKVFEVVDRTTIDKVKAEIVETSTDFYDQETAVQFGKLVGAQALIIGRCSPQSADAPTIVSLVKKEPYEVEEVVETSGGPQKQKVTKYREIQVQGRAMKRTLHLDVSYKAVHVETSKIVGGDTSAKNAEVLWLIEDPRPDLETLRSSPPLGQEVDPKIWFTRALDELSVSVASKLLPQVRREQIEWPPVAQKYAENAGAFFQHGQFDRCRALLVDEIQRADSDKNLPDGERAKLYYMLGVTLGCLQDYDTAIEKLRIASDLAPGDFTLGMLRRVETWKKDAEELRKQIQG